MAIIMNLTRCLSGRQTSGFISLYLTPPYYTTSSHKHQAAPPSTPPPSPLLCSYSVGADWSWDIKICVLIMFIKYKLEQASNQGLPPALSSLIFPLNNSTINSVLFKSSDPIQYFLANSQNKVILPTHPLPPPGDNLGYLDICQG